MKAEYLNSFIYGLLSVIEQMAPAYKVLCRGPLRVVTDTIDINTIGASISISGDLSGQVIYKYEPVFDRALCASICNGAFEIDREILRSAMSEISNMAAGTAMIELYEKFSKKCDISPPQLLGTEVRKVDIPGPCVAMPFLLANNEMMTMYLSLRGGDNNGSSEKYSG